ncbi:MAG TPA: AAA family ATPase [Gemmatimonadaceae bacterium]|nr:AAA family ATPase [Gemmatimonadaceae bacterium]
MREPSLRFAAIPFRGRDADVRDLRKHITRACNGTPTLYLIGAEPGIGKTRLLEETSGLAALEGVKVHTVRCHSHYAGRPLSVFIELVPALRASRGALGISPDSLECLNFLTSHTDDRSDQPSDARDNVTRSELLLAALRDLIDAVASEQPLMLCVEDAHWADPDSLRELNRLVQSPASRPLIVICTTRTPESFPHIPATDDRTVVRRLKPLSEASMVGLAQHLLPQDGAADPAVTSWCVETAAGNPLFLQMLCAHHATTREPFSVPADLTAAITRRVEQLNPRCRRVLELTSLLGRHSTIETIRLINDWTHLELLDAVQVLEEDGYLRDTGTSLRAHGLVGECALSLLPPVSRRVLHACVAAALETQYTERGDAALLWDCAEQWVKSGDSEKAVEFLRRCARHTRQLGRSAEAVSILKRAKELTSSRGASDAMSTEIILAAKAANMWHVAYETSRAIASIVSNAHDEVELASIEAEWFFLSQPATSIPRVTQCMRTLETGHLHRIAAARLAIMMAHEACDAQLGQSLFAEVEPLIAVHPDSIDGQLLTLYFHAIFGSKDVALGMSRELRARISSVATGDRFRVATITAVACVFCGAYDEAIEILSRSVAEAREQELFTRVHNIASTACSTLLSALRYDEAMIWYELAQEVKPHAEQGMRSAIHLSNEVELAILEESAKRATDALSEFNNLAISNSPRFRSYALGLRTRVAQLARDFVLDPAAFEEMLDLHLRTRAYGSGDSLATALAEDLRRRKDPSLQPFLASYVSERREGPNLTAHFRAFVD